MKILSLSCKSFRSFRALGGWNPADLNVVIGPNSSGKSNLLRCIDFMAASAQGRLAETVQQAGGLDPMIWDGDGDDLGISMECSPVNPGNGPLDYDLRLSRLGKGGDYSIGFEQLASFKRVQQGSAGKPFKFIDRAGSRVRVFDESEKAVVAPEDEVPVAETMVSLAKGPFTANRVISQFRAQLAGFSVYQDFHTNREAAVRQPSITRMEKRVNADGQNLISVLHTLYTGDRDFKNEVNDAMRAAFGADFEELVFPPASDQRIQLRIRWRSLRREQSAAELSDGTLRFLFLLTVLATPDPAPVIAIDEPETGLHPSMLPIIAEYAVEASKRAQVILTTHSPQLLDAFSETRPQTTVVYREEGETHLRVLEDAKLAEWLEEYSLGSLFRTGELEEMS
jgi:predicted ATPase